MKTLSAVVAAALLSGASLAPRAPQVRVLWSFPTGQELKGEAVVRRLAQSGHLVAFCQSGRDSAHVDALDARTGVPRWTRTFGRYRIPAPLVAGEVLGPRRTGLLVVHQALEALDAATGATAWSWRAPKERPIYGPPILHDVNGDGTQDVIAASGLRGGSEVTALDGRTGDVLWRRSLRGRVTGNPSLGGDPARPIAVVCARSLNGVAAKDGGARWSREFSDGLLHTFPARLDRGPAGHVLGIRYSRMLIAIDPETGRMLWSHAANGWAEDPTVSDVDGDGEPEVLLLTRGRQNPQHLLALAGLTGRQRWATPLPREVAYPCGRPALADVDRDGRPEALLLTWDRKARQAALEVFDATTGRLRQTWPAGDAPLFEPVVADVDGDGAAEVLAHRAEYRAGVRSRLLALKLDR